MSNELYGPPSVVALCNRCNWPTNRRRCTNCGDVEFRLLGGFDAEYEAWVELKRAEKLKRKGAIDAS